MTTIHSIIRFTLCCLAVLLLGGTAGSALGGSMVVIVGGLVGGFLFNLIGVPGATGFNIWSVFVAFIGAVVLLAVIRMFSGSRSAPI